MRIVIYI